MAAAQAGRTAPRDTVSVEGHAVGFSRRGAGPDVVLLHGTMTSREEMLAALGPVLGERHRVTAFDRPGHGASGRPARDGSLRTQARLVAGAARALGLSAPVLVGHSAGGALALQIALDHPDLVAGVVAVAPLAFLEPRFELALFGPRGLPLVGPALVQPLLRPSDGISLPLLWNAIFLPQAMPAPAAAALPFAELSDPAELVRTGEDALALGADLLRNAFRYPACRVPVRVLAGGADIVVNNRAQGWLLSRLMPDCGYEELPGLGHMLHHFAPGRVLAAVEALGGRAVSQTTALDGRRRRAI